MVQENLSSDLKSIEQDSYRETISDGLLWIFAGFLFLFASLIYDDQTYLLIFLVLMPLFLPRIMERIRSRYVYPRVGYVKVKSDIDFDIGSISIFFIAVIAMSGVQILLLPNGFEDTGNLYRVAPFTVGMIMFGPAIDLVTRTGQDRYYLVGILPTVSGLAITVASVTDELWSEFAGLVLFLRIWGVLILILGLIRFIWYIRQIPIEEDVPDGI